jgi:Tfp pilus assembly protein PilZ
MQEHRRERRVDNPLIDVKGAWTAVYNVSLGGMSGVTMEPVEIGEQRTFELEERGGGEDWQITGHVVWVLPVDDEHRCLGVQWQELEPEAREWLMRQLGA